MFIKKTWHFRSNFPLHICVYCVGLISTMQIIVKYWKLYKYYWGRNYIKMLGRNRTNLDPESKEKRSTWLSNREMLESPYSVLQNKKVSVVREAGADDHAHRAWTSLTWGILWKSWTSQATGESEHEQIPTVCWVWNTSEYSKYHVCPYSVRELLLIRTLNALVKFSIFLCINLVHVHKE